MKRSALTALFVFAAAATLRAGDGATPKLPLDKLLEMPISTAAKYDQQVSSVAASVSVITAEEIERYGWTTLAEVLQAVRGFFLTYDRDYTYIGVRGIGRPTDYNNRLLILLDGVALNEPFIGKATVGDDLAIDLGAVEKIEIVRGPGSALYGTHAMLAVINIITKNADGMDRLRFTVSGGSGGKQAASFGTGKVFANGLRVTASATWMETNGNNLYFPEFDSPQTNRGVAEGLDYSDARSAAFGLQKGNLRLSISSRTSTKGVPTASYDTRFNAASFAANQRDLIDAEYRRRLVKNVTLELHGTWDRARYHGEWPYDAVGTDLSYARNTSGEVRLQWDISSKQRLTAGLEYANASRLRYSYDVGDFHTDLERPNDMTSYYVQYESHPSRQLGFVAGVRRDDYYATADSTNPRAAILFTPNRSTSFKLLYGSAFRSPNIYEAFYADPLTPWKAHPDLKPETIRTTELDWEQRFSPTTLMVAAAFHISADALIEQELEPASQIYWYNNLGSMESNGVEAALHVRREDGIWARFSASAQHVRSGGQPASNAPHYLLKSGLSNSPWASWHAGIEGVFEAARRTRDGEHTDPFLLVNAIVSHQLGQHFRLALTSRNLLNARYSTPVGPEMRPQSIRQDGRTFTLRLTYSR